MSRQGRDPAGPARRAGPAGGARELVAAAVLAGGASQRMGRDKATLAVGGVPLARRVLAAAAGVAGTVVLVAPAGHPARGLHSAVVTDPGTGPLAALRAAAAALTAPYVLVLACDHPDLRTELLQLLVAERREGAAVVCRRAGRLEPLVALYPRAAALAAADACLAGGERSLRQLLARLDLHVLEEPAWRAADPDGRSFADLDHPADLAAWG